MNTTKVFWLTGLSGAGKTTIAEALFANIREQGKPACLLDGDILRKGLCRDLGFSEVDRLENMRRIGEVVRLFYMAEVNVVAAFISPMRQGRSLVRELLPPQAFVEIYVNTPLHECERRDPKGLYKKARKGEIQNFTGITAPYECPLTPDVVIDTLSLRVEDCVAHIIQTACFTITSEC